MSKEYRKLPEELRIAFENEIKVLLHAARDCMRNRGEDTLKFSFSIYNEYCSEAFGIARALKIMQYGDFGAVNDEPNVRHLSAWMAKLENEVLKEENFNGSHECDHCYKKYGKDDVRRKPLGPISMGREIE